MEKETERQSERQQIRKHNIGNGTANKTKTRRKRMKNRKKKRKIRDLQKKICFCSDKRGPITALHKGDSLFDAGLKRTEPAQLVCRPKKRRNFFAKQNCCENFVRSSLLAIINAHFKVY
jgi:hypothetical protein